MSVVEQVAGSGLKKVLYKTLNYCWTWWVIWWHLEAKFTTIKYSISKCLQPVLFIFGLSVNSTEMTLSPSFASFASFRKGCPSKKGNHWQFCDILVAAGTLFIRTSEATRWELSFSPYPQSLTGSCNWPPCYGTKFSLH